MIRLEQVLKTSLQDALKTSWRCLEDVFARRLEDVLKTYSQGEYIGLDQDVLKTSSEDVRLRQTYSSRWRRLENVLKILLQDVLKMSWRRLQNVLKTSWRCLEDVLKTFLQDVLKTSWKRLEDVLKTYSQDEYIGLDQDVFWRRKAKANIFVLIKTSWRRLLKTKTKDVFKTSSRRLHQDECLLGYFYVQTSQQPTLKMFSLPQPFRQFRLHQVTRGSCEDWHCLNSLFFHKIWIVITGGSQSLIPYRSDPENWSTAGIGLWWRCLQLEWQTTQSTFSHTLNLLSLLSYPTNTITRTHSLLETICLTWFSS